MTEDVRSMAERYISTVELALGELTVKEFQPVAHPKLIQVIDTVKRYVIDAKYFLNTGRETTALTSISYAEGLLDALRMLGFVAFSWRRVFEP